jgi:integration host factor subunit beta
VTRADLIDELSKAFRFPKPESERIITTIFETMTEALVRGEKVELRGFGSLRIRHRKPRAGRNPKTGAAVDVPPKRVPKLAGQELRRSLNN